MTLEKAGFLKQWMKSINLKEKIKDVEQLDYSSTIDAKMEYCLVIPHRAVNSYLLWLRIPLMVYIKGIYSNMYLKSDTRQFIETIFKIAVRNNSNVLKCRRYGQILAYFPYSHLKCISFSSSLIFSFSISRPPNLSTVVSIFAFFPSDLMQVFLSKLNHLTWPRDPISSCFLV